MTKEEANRLIEATFKNPFDESQFRRFVKNLLNDVNESKAFEYHGTFIPDAYGDYIRQYKRLGQYTDPEGNVLDVLTVRLRKESSLDRARTMQRNFIATYFKRRGDDKDNALVAFYHDDLDDWRFSYVRRDYRLEQTESGKVKIREELSPARRYSFLVGTTEPSHTAQQQLVPILQDDRNNPTLSQLDEAFNIEKVTREFFEKYRALYLKLKEELDELVKNDQKIREEFTTKNIATENFAKKLLGQIIFLYFIQKKGWMGVEKDASGNYKPWGAGPKDFLRKLYEKKYINYKNFFNDVLEPLFYQALAIDRGEVPEFTQFKCKIPFLNGGLFEPIGGYSWEETDILIKNETIEQILDSFDLYNFTVREDEPLEKEVAVDPEMLGKVFENLLKVKDRKSKGTYYTPREIVHYMCQESLINYLDTALNTHQEPFVKQRPVQQKLLGNPDPEQLGLTMSDYKPTVPKGDIEEFIRKGELIIQHDMRVINEGKETKTYPLRLPEFIRENAERIDDTLTSMKICDPAVGSGAFLVGMMQEIVKVREILTTYMGESPERTAYNFKRHCIQESIYGVDIDPSAVDIAKLRLWLSLVVDEADFERIKPLPNLEYKVVCGNSLLGVEKDLFNEQLFKLLETLKSQYFEETNPREKDELKRKIDSLIKQITNNDEHFDFQVYFSEVFHKKGGFDVVIANPPYVRQEQIKPLKSLLQKQGYSVYNSTSDIYTYFLEKAYNILKPLGISTFITSNKWMRAKYGDKLRQFFRKQTNINRIIDFGGYKVFDATVDTNITIFQKPKDRNNLNQTISFTLINEDYRAKQIIEDYIKTHTLEIPQQALDDKHFTFADNIVLRLKEKIERIGTPLGNWDINIYRGIITGLNEAFVIDTLTKERLCAEDPKSADIIKPLLRGRDIHKYFYEWAGLWLIFIPWHFPLHNDKNIVGASKRAEKLFQEEYPALYKHLSQYKEKLSKRNKDEIGIRYEWHALQRCAATYYAEFGKEKIVYPVIGTESLFCFDTRGYFHNDKVFHITGDTLRFLIAILNSRLTFWYLLKIGSGLGKEGFEFRKIYLEQLPIPKIPDQKQQPFISLVDKILSITNDDHYLENPKNQAQVKEYERQIDQMVYKLYGLTQEEIAIIGNLNRN